MKSVFRTIVLAGLAWIVGLSAYAADYVKVSEKGGKDTYFALSDKPEVTFTADHLVLKTAKETINYPLSALLTFEFTNRPTGMPSARKKTTLSSLSNKCSKDKVCSPAAVSAFTL